MEGISFLLCTVHRAENTDNIKRFTALVKALNRLAHDWQIIIALHPRKANIIAQNGLYLKVMTIPPVGYLDMICLISQCSLVLTDSGGMQKESYFFDKYCITSCDETEWVECVEHGYNVLAGTERKKIVEYVEKLIDQPFTKLDYFYGGRTATQTIASCLSSL